MVNRWGNSGSSDWLFLGSKMTVDGDCSLEIKRCLLLGRKGMTNLDSILKSRDITLPTKVHLVKAMVCSHVWMWELDYKESWVPKNWYFWTVVLEKTLESPLDCKEIQPVHLKEISPGCSLEGLMLKFQYFGHLDTGKDWRQEEKGTTEDEMVGWHHRLNWTWVWINSGSWWWTGTPGVLRSMVSQRVWHDWATKKQELNIPKYCHFNM